MTPLVGTVLERDGSVYRVATPGSEVRAILRGKAKRDAPRVVVGDRVQLDLEPGGEYHGIIGVEPRTSLLERRVPEGRGTRPVAANIDEVFVVTATVDPAPMFAASIDARMSPAPSERPATKKSALCLTKRAVHNPNAMMPAE